MKIADIYSHNNGEVLLKVNKATLWHEVYDFIEHIDVGSTRQVDPISDAEIVRASRSGVNRLYSPRKLHTLIESFMVMENWTLKPRLSSTENGGYRRVDFLKDRVALEFHVGKYMYLTYTLVVTLATFRNAGLVDYGIGLCPMSAMCSHFPNDVGSFEQVWWDLRNRSDARTDVPIVLIGLMMV